MTHRFIISIEAVEGSEWWMAKASPLPRGHGTPRVSCDTTIAVSNPTHRRFDTVLWG